MRATIAAWTVLTLAATLGARSAVAAEADPCRGPVSRETVVGCALRASLAIRGERAGLRAAEGAKKGAGVLLPSNPSLALTGGHAVDRPWSGDALVWGAALSQELEIGGQRGKRLAVADASYAAQKRRVDASERQIAADALVAYFDVLSAAEEQRLTDRLRKIAEALRTYAEARASVGLASPVDAIAARAAAVKVERARIEADQRVRATTATLTTLLGFDPVRERVDASGDLTPLPVRDAPLDRLVAAGLERRADLRVAAAEGEAQERRRALFASMRVPNPTVSAFVRRDWIDELAAGVGLTIPIPLPAPVGRTYAGEIAEASALAERAKNDVERVRRDVRLQIVNARTELESAQKALDLFRAEDLTRAEAALDAIAEELASQRLAIRDALVTEQALLEFLLARVAAQRALCVASVEIARATGEPLEPTAR